MAITVVLTPVLQKAEKTPILPRDWRLFQRNYNFEKNQSQLEAFHLNAFLNVLKKHLCEENMNAKFHWHYISVWGIGPNQTAMI